MTELTQPARPKPPNAGKGRKKGSKNKYSLGVKEAFEHAFNEIGGGEGLAVWAQDNRTEFYKLFARLIPTEQRVAGADGGLLEVLVRGIPGRS